MSHPHTTPDEPEVRRPLRQDVLDADTLNKLISSDDTDLAADTIINADDQAGVFLEVLAGNFADAYSDSTASGTSPSVVAATSFRDDLIAAVHDLPGLIDAVEQAAHDARYAYPDWAAWCMYCVTAAPGSNDDKPRMAQRMSFLADVASTDEIEMIMRSSAREIARDSGDQFAAATTARDLAIFMMSIDDEDAYDDLQAAHAALTALDAPAEAAYAEVMIATRSVEPYKVAATRRRLAELAEIMDEHDAHRHGIVCAMMQNALAEAADDTVDALTHLERSERLAVAIGNYPVAADSALQRAALLPTDDAAPVLACFEAAASHYRAISLESAALQAEIQAASTLVMHGNIDEAEKVVATILEAGETLQLGAIRGPLNLVQGMIHRHHKNLDDAQHHFKTARTFLAAAQDARGVAECDFALAGVTLDQGRTKPAIKLFKRAKKSYLEIDLTEQAADCDTIIKNHS